jgi:hypothetical protein
VQVRSVVGVDPGDPLVEASAVPAGERVSEPGDVPGDGVQVRAAGQHVF